MLDLLVILGLVVNVLGEAIQSFNKKDDFPFDT